MDIVSLLIGFAVGGLVFGIACFFAGISHRKKKAEGILGSAEEESKRILNDALKNAEAKKKETILEAKDEIHRLRTESDKENRERRSELQRQERRLQQKEESLDKKTDNIEKKEDALRARQKEIESRLNEAEELKKRQFEMLERISGLTTEQAKDYLLKNLEGELDHDKALLIREYEQRLKDEADEKSRHILSQCIQRCAADHSSEATVSVVPLPNDDMKGRIIGRAGRNIRAIETATGVDLIIDDTPEAITLSCFEPVRREIARLTLEKLIADGRIHHELF